ncbi:LADA_0H12002g1_1 [Lachancea dasiensis]|uniref:LADA_0H12002g1_1 n=1 Tax=Lachancea dasiensis TaxID=1072105 RepID=A0A1G4K3M0_9SACH|nr:LADA_0H12002g1_1 [Lachancea dasiensis]
MTEQISHKRPVRLKVDKERRKQLHEFYNLKDEPEDTGDKDGSRPKEAVELPVDTADTNHTEVGNGTSNASVEEVGISIPTVSECTISQLIHTHNALLSKKAEMNNNIKNAVYENYYDLIKVNELLHSVSGSENEHLKQLKSVIKLLDES